MQIFVAKTRKQHEIEDAKSQKKNCEFFFFFFNWKRKEKGTKTNTKIKKIQTKPNN